MPSRAKLTTRGISTTTVTTDALPKNAAMTNNELDSNFLNLRDQTFSIVGDDSSGIDIKAGDTIKFLGAGGATITAVGDTITVTAGGGGGSAITFVGDDSTGTAVSTGETIKIAGAGGITTAVSGDTLTITGSGGGSVGDLTVEGSTIISPSNAYLTLQASGTGQLVLNDTTNVRGEIKVATIYPTSESWLEISESKIKTAGTIGERTLTIASGDDGSLDASAIHMDARNIHVGQSNTNINLNATGSQGDFKITNGGTTALPGGFHNYIELTDNNDGEIYISPKSGKNVYLSALQYPNVDGTANQVLITNGSGILSWATVTAAGVINPITFVGDDSTGTAIDHGETLKIAGAGGITTAVSGDVLTITGSGGLGTLQVNGNTLSPISTNNDLQIQANGTGYVVIDGLQYPQSDGSAGQFLMTNGTGNISFQTVQNIGDISIIGTTISAGVTNADITIESSGTGNLNVTMDTVRVGDSNANATITTNGTGDLILSTNSGTNSGTITIQDGANQPILIEPNGTGDIYLTSDQIVLGDSNATATISTTGSGTLVLNTNTGNNTGNITITTGINQDISLTPNGTGKVKAETSEFRLGITNTDTKLTSNGTANLTLDTNSGTNSGSIVIADGANGNITVAVNGTGYLDLHKSFDSTNFPQTPATSNTNWAAATSATYVGTRMLYSNQAQGDITQAEQRVRANTRLISIKHPNDSTTYNDTDYIIQNTDLVVLDINGQAFGSTLTGSRGAGVRGEANNVILKNTAGGTKIGPNLIGGSAFCEVENGHTGDLTVENVMGFRSLISNRANTSEFTRITNAYGFVSEPISTGGTGASGTNRFVTNEYAFYDAPSTATSLITNHYGYYVHTGAAATNKYAFYSADDAYLSRLGTIERYREKQNALTSSSTITVDADLAPVHTVTLATNTQIGITGLSTGQTVTLIITQDATGSRTASFTSDTSTTVKFAGGTPTLSTAANAIDVVRVYNDGTNFLGVIEKAYA